MKLTLTTLTILLSTVLFSQEQKDSILLLNGKVYYGDVIGIEEIEYDSVVKLQSTDKKGNIKVDFIETYRVFSYTDQGASHIVYYQDEFAGNYLTEQETKEVTIGSYDARKKFKPHFPFWSGFALGLGVSIYDTYLTKKEALDSSLIAPKEPGFFKKPPSIFPFLIPPVVAVTWSFPTFKVKRKNMIHKSYFNNTNYYRGYHRIAKQRRMLGSLIGSVAGIASGMIIYYVAN